MKLDRIQKDWILDQFFKIEQYPGWKNIATKLIEDGICITSKEGSMWFGGVGNFIKDKPFLGGIDLLELTFDLDTFLNSQYFLEYYNLKLEEVKEELDRYEKIANSFINLTKVMKGY